jgi:hypothetical protein
MNIDNWKWQPGKVNLSDRYFELKYGYDPKPVTRIGIGNDKIFLVEFLLDVNDDIEKLKEIFSEVLWEIELYLINNSEPDPVEYMINHTKKCANVYGKVHWNYFPKGANKPINLKKESTFISSLSFVKEFYVKIFH